MRRSIFSRFSTYQSILTNATSLVGTLAVTSVLGFGYWWLAARLFSPAAVGLASAAISAMMLLGTMSMLGLGTLLMGFLPRQRECAGALITTALLVVGGAGIVPGLLFVLVAPLLDSDLQILADSPAHIALFTLGVSLTAMVLVLDQALIGLLLGGRQLWRNTVFALSKLALLLLAGRSLMARDGALIYAVHVAGMIISLVILVRPGWFRQDWKKMLCPEWGLVRGLGHLALRHHLFNLMLQAPGLMLPLVVTMVLSVTLNASFYVAWMLAGFVFVIPAALTTVLYADGSAQPEALARKARFTFGLALLLGAVACLLLWLSARWVLGLFGASYAAQAVWCLRGLSFGVFPLIVKSHYVAICRVRSQIGRAALLIAVGSLLELVFAAVGATMGELAGLSVGWCLALGIEALLMGPTVQRTIRTIKPIAEAEPLPAEVTQPNISYHRP